MIDKDIDQKQHDEIINILNKNENKVKTCYLEAKQSTTAKIIVCLVTLVSIIPGWIMYFCLRDELLYYEAKTCRKLLIILTLIWVVLIISGIIFLFVTGCNTGKYLLTE